MKGLYRVSVKPIHSWGSKKKPVYVVEDSKKKPVYVVEDSITAARKYVDKYLKHGYVSGNVSFLGEQIAGHMFHSS